MEKCNINHSIDNVHRKLDSQRGFLPESLYVQIKSFLNGFNQDQLNEMFHLLKKYDLSKVDEQAIRNKKMKHLVSK